MVKIMSMNLDHMILYANPQAIHKLVGRNLDILNTSDLYPCHWLIRLRYLLVMI